MPHTFLQFPWMGPRRFLSVTEALQSLALPEQAVARRKQLPEMGIG